MKKTAVQWLVEQVNSDCLNSSFIRPDLIKQAEEMEKENSEISFFAGYNYERGHPIDEHEKFYTETFTKPEPK
jgi:hypothetical protein